MAYGEAKVYFDGSHYIAIPHTTRPSKRRVLIEEEKLEVKDNNDNEDVANTFLNNDIVSYDLEKIEFEDIEVEGEIFKENEKEIKSSQPKKEVRKATRKELFEKSYKELRGLRKAKLKSELVQKMAPYFNSLEEAKYFVDRHLERKQRNLILRRIRLVRKANLQEFNFFCTFTYDDKKHSEETFRYKLRHTISNFAKRKGWKYIGVWERSPENNRLHFHGIFYIPDGTMPGEIIEVYDYSFKTHKRQITHQNTYFNERFGRSDMESIDDPLRKGDALAYLLKYIEKSGERIVYSKGLPQFFVSDILDEDVVTRFGIDDSKLLLFDNFSCYDNGEYIGVVGCEAISRLRKIN